MADDYYRIKTTYHCKILPQLLQTPIASFLKDFTLICEKKKVQAHKLVLAMYSKFFEDMFIECPELHSYNFLPDTDFEDLEVFLEYIYTGKLIFRRSRLFPLMKLIAHLKVRGFVDLCDGIHDYKALAADLFQNSDHVHDRENPDSSVKNDHHQASTVVADQVREDNGHQESLLPAATVVKDVCSVHDVNHQDLVLAPLSVDEAHNISYPRAPELETK